MQVVCETQHASRGMHAGEVMAMHPQVRQLHATTGSVQIVTISWQKSIHKLRSAEGSPICSPTQQLTFHVSADTDLRSLRLPPPQRAIVLTLLCHAALRHSSVQVVTLRLRQ